MINEININGWNNKVVAHPKLVYPQCNDEGAPRNYFVAIFAGARGSGKTYLLTKLLKTFEEKKCYKEIYQQGERSQIINAIKNVKSEDRADVIKNTKELVKKLISKTILPMFLSACH
jgi:predicted AAA+ superfamily ATPase